MEQLTPVFFFQQENCYQQSTKMRCPSPTKAWSYNNTCAAVTASTWAAHLKDCIIELHNTSRNPSEPNPYPQRTFPTRDCKTKMLNIVNDVIFYLTKIQTRFSCYKKTELKRPANVFSCCTKL